MESNCTSLPKLRKKIQLNKRQLCKGCYFLEEKSCTIPPLLYKDPRFMCSKFTSDYQYRFDYIFIKEEK
jgi:hypothetical protein